MPSGNIASVPHYKATEGWVVGDGVTPVRGRLVGGSAFGGGCVLYDGDPVASPPGTRIAQASGTTQASFDVQGRYVPFTMGIYAVQGVAVSCLVYTEGS